MRSYSQPIVRTLDPRTLRVLSEEDADRGEADGLEGNQHYRDLRGISWSQLEAGLHTEAELIERLAAAADLDAEAERIDEDVVEGVSLASMVARTLISTGSHKSL